MSPQAGISKHYELLDFNEAVNHATRGISIEEDQLTEVRSGLLHSYISKSQDQVRRGKFGSGNLRLQVRKRTNRVVGVKRANARLDKEPALEQNETLDSDVSIRDFIHDFIKSKNKKFSGDSRKRRIRRAIGAFSHQKTEDLGDVAAHLATHVVAQGFGVHPALLHALARSKEPKSAKTPTRVKLNKPVHMKPATHHDEPHHDDGSVHMHMVYHGEPGEHERNHLQQALNHHNTGMAAKSAGDHSKAEIHFRARDKQFKNYVSNAPRENLKKLNQDKVKGVFNR